MPGEIIDRLFPHRDARDRPSYRRHQREIILDMVRAFDDPSVKDVVVEAPTGSGKTSMLVTLARYASRDFDKESKGVIERDLLDGALAEYQVHMITSMKLLQDAYLQDDRSISLVKGRSNYRCVVHRGLTCEEAPGIYGDRCGSMCPYKNAIKEAKMTPIALHNFDSFLYQVSMGKAFPPRRLITIDEAHNIEEKLLSVMTIEIDPDVLYRMSDIDVDVPDHVDDRESVIDWASNLLALVEKKSRDYEVEIEDGRLSRDKKKTMFRAKAFLDRMKQKVERFLSSQRRDKPAGWSCEISGGIVSLEPIEPGRFVNSSLLAFGKTRVHTSATIMDGRWVYSHSVRLKADTTVKLSVPSTFPVKNRPLVKRFVGDTGYVKWDSHRVSSEIAQIMRENRGVRGVVHVTSYKMAEELMAEIGDKKRFVSYVRGDRGAVEKFLSGSVRNDAVLMAVGLSEGYDFKDDLCRFQVIVRLPYRFKSRRLKEREKLDKSPYYSWLAALNLVQTYGRGVRSDTDYCTTYILDSRFERFLKQENSQLPSWFKEAVI